VTVFNKTDLIDDVTRERLHRLAPDAFLVSSASGDGVDALRAHVEGMLPKPNVHVEALLPYAAGSLLSRIREYGNVESVEYRDDGVMLQADVDEHLAAQVMDQAVDGD
ncbi:MAG: GTPase HflX, partial [Bifidobacterium choerinum]